jgi:hypothetical protein
MKFTTNFIDPFQQGLDTSQFRQPSQRAETFPNRDAAQPKNDQNFIRKSARDFMSKMRYINSGYLNVNIADEREENSNRKQNNFLIKKNARLASSNKQHSEYNIDHGFIQGLVKRENVYPLKFFLDNDTYKGMVKRNYKIVKESLGKRAPGFNKKMIRDYCKNQNIDKEILLNVVNFPPPSNIIIG